MFGWFRKPKAKPTREVIRRVRARYDAAQTNADNQRHWAMADGLSARKANSPEIRKKLRDRSRYEVSNNCYARGILNSLAAYTIGTGPTLALRYQGSDAEAGSDEIRAVSREVELLWQNWADSRGLSAKLFCLRLAMAQDGEGFGLFVSAPRFGDPIELDILVVEADQIEDNGYWPMTSDGSGVKLDRAGRPTEYAVLPEHPGDDVWSFGNPQWVPASQVVHVFRRERPGQTRGIPEITPALELFAQLRRFTLATLTAAETAADFAAIINSEAPASDDEQVAPWERIELERGAMVTAPNGSKISQLKAEHPNATYDEFVKAMLREIARCLSVPAVIALGDASSYNYSSGRLDLQTFQRQVEVDRSLIFEADCLNKIFSAWLDESLLVDGYLPDAFASTASQWKASWRWPAPEHVDRAKEASGQEIELRNNTTTLQREHARRGQDWEAELRQRAKELALIRELGLVTEPSPSATAQEQSAEDQQADTEQTSNA